MRFFALISLIVVSFTRHSQPPVPNFTVKNIDGNSISLDGYKNAAGVAIIFTSNNCPYDIYYKERIRTLIKNYQDKIQFILVNSHQDPEETVEKMKIAYGAWALPVPYLVDKDQIVQQALGARKSPEVFLLKRPDSNRDENFVVVYSGGIDDNPQAPQAVTSYYLKIAIDRLLAAQEINLQPVRSGGCTIRKK